MSLRARINKPEYLYQPRQFLRRLTRAIRREPDEAAVVLPWGLRMRTNPREDHGRSLYHFGIYDLVLSEAIWRLLDPGETAIDVGANMGYVTGLMAARVGPAGSVLAFEPHPKVFAQLISNIECWDGQPVAPISPFEMALSSRNGTSFLAEAPDFERNSGTSTVVEDPSQLQIRVACLDEVCADCRSIGVLKLDVEGHELQVLRGGERFLGESAIRDIIFEEHSRSFNSAAPSLLTEYGYTIFLLTRTFRGPLLAAADKRCWTVPYLPPNFLATLEPERALARFRPSGWRVLR
jgi:FkbM family methyltransferase